MATIWTGFSEEEQNKIKGELNRISTAKQKQERSPDVPAHVKLKIVEDSCFEIMEKAPITNNSPDSCKEENEKNEQQNQTTEHVITHSPQGSPDLVLKSDIVKLEKKEPMNLEEFEKKRKVIEEQNRLRKQMLAKALAMRKMKTQAEAQKLQQIQEELTKLDISLSNDVSILRSHIELASADLAEAERRYAKAEREFIEAKQHLFTKRERKDLLTEHLYAIIEQNEVRKAERLTDLMVQLSEEEHPIEITLNQVAEPVNKTSDKTVDV